LHLSFDTRITAKFSIIMETMGYLLLDFNKRPKQLDRLVGYIAMVHKDMQLDEQDMRVRRFSLFCRRERYNKFLGISMKFKLITIVNTLPNFSFRTSRNPCFNTCREHILRK